MKTRIQDATSDVFEKAKTKSATFRPGRPAGFNLALLEYGKTLVLHDPFVDVKQIKNRIYQRVRLYKQKNPYVDYFIEIIGDEVHCTRIA